jgi:hypothetical protein
MLHPPGQFVIDWSGAPNIYNVFEAARLRNNILFIRDIYGRVQASRLS